MALQRSRVDAFFAFAAKLQDIGELTAKRAGSLVKMAQIGDVRRLGRASPYRGAVARLLPRRLSLPAQRPISTRQKNLCPLLTRGHPVASVFSGEPNFGANWIVL